MLRSQEPRGGGWSTLTWALLVFGTVLSIGLLSLYSFRVASESVQDLVRANNLSAGMIAAELVKHDFDQSRKLARTAATLPGMVEAVERHNEGAVRSLLQTVVQSYHEIDRAYVTDR